MLVESINVLGRQYTVTLSSAIGPDNHGLCDAETAEIQISPALPLDDQQQTLLHEVIHAVLSESGWTYQLAENHISDEGLTRALEHGLWRAGYRLVG